MAENAVPTGRWVLVPAFITLAVTLIRLIGELSGGGSLLFNREAGGGGALIGIVWLVPVFGVYFAWKLIRSGYQGSAGRTAGFGAFGLLILVAGVAIVVSVFQETSATQLTLTGVVALLSVLVLRRGWPELYDLLLTYGIAARIPVALIMLFAIRGSWGTHYDGAPEGFPEMAWFWKWVVIGAVPQLTIWIAITVIFGMLFGALVLALLGRKKLAA